MVKSIFRLYIPFRRSKNLIFFTALLLMCAAVNGQGIKQLFGATQAGGTHGIGVTSTLSYLGNNLQPRYSFQMTNPGGFPNFHDMAGWNGKLYGCLQGGQANQGLLFEWDPLTNTYTDKFDFTGNDGSNPDASLFLYNNKLYGTTRTGGVNGRGVFFEWDPATGVYTKRYDFSLAAGSNPTGRLAMYNSKIYGLTGGGGANGLGVLFEWDPATNSYSKKIDLSSSSGYNPQYGGLSFYNNKFYGLCHSGGSFSRGTLFEWDPAGNILTKKYDFNTSGGFNPYGDLTLYNNKLYGMTYNGGSFSRGVIFEWDPATNMYTLQFSFSGMADGGNPFGELLLYNNKFYGLTAAGGTNELGVIFEWDPATGIFVKKYEFAAGAYGNYPTGNIIFYNNKFYGAANSGGTYNQGVLFEYDLSGNTYTKKIDLAKSDGSNFYGMVSYYNGKFYGSASRGGNSNQGVIFEWDPQSSLYTKKQDMGAATGFYPQGTMTLFSNNKFYGLCSDGGAQNQGVLYEWDPATNTYTVKKNFSSLNTDGYSPQGGSLLLYNNKLYGLLTSGGSGFAGVLFDYDPLTDTYHVDYNFSLFTTSEGYSPGGSLLAYNNKIYGFTTNGGTNNRGVIFEYDPAGAAYTKRADLSTGSGYDNDYGVGFALYNNKLYASPSNGGASNGGTILEFDPASGTLTKKYDFPSYPQPSQPCGIPQVYKDSLYGFTAIGGTNTVGAVYKYDPGANSVSNVQSLNLLNGQNPYSGNGFILRDALIAMTAANTCAQVNSITIDNTNNNQWVPVTDSKSDVVAEIKANGSNLGQVSTSVYRNTGPVRDFISAPYCDRNITITPQSQPGSPVDIRLYITNAEFEALKNAPGSGISSINDVAIYKNNDPCYPEVRNATTQLATTRSSYDWGYVLSATINSFSSFFFTRGGFVLPLQLVSFTAQKQADAVLLKWTTANEEGVVRFELESGEDGNHFSRIGEIPALNGGAAHSYQYTDLRSWTGNIRYYRVRMLKADGKFVYSDIIPVKQSLTAETGVYPNPARDQLNIEGWTGMTRLQVYDLAGRQLLSLQPQSVISLGQLPRGTYVLKIQMKDGSSKEQKLLLLP